MALGIALLLAVLALAMYRPWEPRPFDTRDFSEFLPLLQGPDGLVGRFGAMLRYYVGEHGRLNLFSYLGLALKWTLLGPSPVLWQWARFVEMGLITIGAGLLFRRLGLGPVAASASASLFIVSRLAGEGWTRMTMGEPLGLLMSLGALHLATGWREARRPVLAAAGAGVLMMLAVLAKEMLLGLLPFVWLVVCCRREDGSLGRPVFDPATRRALFWSSIPPMAAFAAAALVALGGRSEGFTALYGGSASGLGEFTRLLARPWLIQGVAIDTDALLLPGNTCFLLVIAAGVALSWRARGRPVELAGAGLVAVGLSLAYAILYIPWPYSYLYYAMPFLLGTAFLFGMAFHRLTESGRGGRIAALIGWAGVVLGTAPATSQSASFAIALQQVNGEVVSWLGRVPNADRIVVARGSLAPQAWMGTGPTLRRFALVTGAAHDLPPAADMLCPDVGSLIRNGIGRAIVISYRPGCGGIKPSSASVSRPFRYVWVWWDGAGVAMDSVGADMLVSRETMMPPSGIAP